MTDFLDRYGLQLRAARQRRRRRAVRVSLLAVASPAVAAVAVILASSSPDVGASGHAHGHGIADARHVDARGRSAGQRHSRDDRPHAGLARSHQRARGPPAPADRPRPSPRRASAALRRPPERGRAGRRRPRAEHPLRASADGAARVAPRPGTVRHRQRRECLLAGGHGAPPRRGQRQRRQAGDALCRRRAGRDRTRAVHAPDRSAGRDRGARELLRAAHPRHRAARPGHASPELEGPDGQGRQDRGPPMPAHGKLEWIDGNGNALPPGRP